MRNRLRISTPSSVLLDVCLGPSPPLISDDSTAPTKTTFPMSLSGSVSTITTSTITNPQNHYWYRTISNTTSTMTITGAS